MNLRKIIREESNELKWMKDAAESTYLNVNELNKDGENLTTFYFYPKITLEQYNEYVRPVIERAYGYEDSTNIEYLPDGTIDYTEIDHNEHMVNSGDVNYGHDDEIRRREGRLEDCETIECFLNFLGGADRVNNGRLLFNIPNDINEQDDLEWVKEIKANPIREILNGDKYRYVGLVCKTEDETLATLHGLMSMGFDVIDDSPEERLRKLDGDEIQGDLILWVSLSNQTFVRDDKTYIGMIQQGGTEDEVESDDIIIDNPFI